MDPARPAARVGAGAGSDDDYRLKKGYPEEVKEIFMTSTQENRFERVINTHTK